MAPSVRDTTGKTVNVHDTLNGTALSLKHAIYQLETGASGRSPHPECWTASTEHLKSVLTKLGQLTELVAAEIKDGKNASDLSAEDTAVAAATVKHLKQVSRSLNSAARNARHAHSCLDSIGKTI